MRCSPLVVALSIFAATSSAAEADGRWSRRAKRASATDVTRAVDVASRAQTLAAQASHGAYWNGVSPRFLRFRRAGRRPTVLRPHEAVARLERGRPVEVAVVERVQGSVVDVTPAVGLGSVEQLLDWASRDGDGKLPYRSLTGLWPAADLVGSHSTLNLFRRWGRLQRASRALFAAAIASFAIPPIVAFVASVAALVDQPGLPLIGVIWYPTIALLAGSIPMAGFLAAQSAVDRRADRLATRLTRRAESSPAALAPELVEVATGDVRVDWDAELRAATGPK